MATRTVTDADGTSYEETLKRFSGIPADLVELASREVEKRSAAEGRRVKVGEVYGDIITSYMNAVRSGAENPAIIAKPREGKETLGVWIRAEIADAFSEFVKALPRGSESEVLSAALRWRFGPSLGE